MTTYSQLRRQLAAGRNGRKKLANNTYVAPRGDDAVAVTLHDTDVLLFKSDGTVRYDTGGWRTTTTKDRLNGFGPARVYITKGTWRISGPGWDIPFTDGVTVTSNDLGILVPVEGTYPDPGEEERIAKAAKRLADDIKAYLKKAEPYYERWGKALTEDGVLSTAGDCLYCQGMVSNPDGTPFGGVEHLWSHLREQYVFPTLFLNALADKGYRDPQYIFALAVTTKGPKKDLNGTLTKFLKKHLDPSQAPVQPRDARLAGYVEAAREALTRPSAFGYFGSDEHLWSVSAPTWTKTRDSENEDLANYEFVWDHLKQEFPDLFTHLDGDERTVDRDFNEWPAIYEFGAGHWAVGHIDQIVVPVVQDADRPVDEDNLHPAFIRVMEFVYAAREYPVLDGAEDYLDALNAEDALRAARQYLGEGLTHEEYDRVLAVIVGVHGDPWDAEGVDWYRAAVSVGVEPGDHLTERYAEEAYEVECPAEVDGQQSLL